jgi:hypothetical protein
MLRPIFSNVLPHSRTALEEIASKEPELLNADNLRDALSHLESINDRDPTSSITKALDTVAGVSRKETYRYGL